MFATYMNLNYITSEGQYNDNIQACKTVYSGGICMMVIYYKINCVGGREPNSYINNLCVAYYVGLSSYSYMRPPIVEFMFFIRKFPGWNAGGQVCYLTLATHYIATL